MEYCDSTQKNNCWVFDKYCNSDNVKFKNIATINSVHSATKDSHAAEAVAAAAASQAAPAATAEAASGCQAEVEKPGGFSEKTTGGQR